MYVLKEDVILRHAFISDPQWWLVICILAFNLSLSHIHTHTHTHKCTHTYPFLPSLWNYDNWGNWYVIPTNLHSNYLGIVKINRSFCRGLYSFYVPIKKALSIKLQIKNKHLLRILDFRDFPFLLFLLCWIFVLEMFYLDFSQLSFWKGLPGTSDSEESVCNVGGLGLIPGSGTSPGKRKGSPLQYSGLENSVDRGTWCALC